ncbi:unnamed protein product, partial [Darwinula stevensoni]
MGESNLITIGSEMFNNMGLLPANIEEEIDTKSLDDLIQELDSLTGLENIKQEVKDYVQYLNFLVIRKEKGYDDNSGNPGTGKTTVARLLGKIFHKLGFLSKGHIHEVDRADLVAEYIGQTAPKVKEAIDAARGGILFIDEAYSLYRSGEDTKDFGREVIEILLKEMSDGKGDIAVFVAGYPKEMEVFLDSNPGLKSRFSHYYYFQDYTPQELEEIALLEYNKYKLNLLPEAKALLSKKLVDAYRSRTNSFGNARMVISLVNESKMNMGIRLMKNENVKELPAEVFAEITEADIKETAIKTTEMIDKAKGSVLFIDEAYSLTSGHGGDFGNEAIDTLLKRMEDQRGEFIVIVAGYTDRMMNFLESNPGLRSRFDRKFDFEDYSAEELQTIFFNMLSSEELKLDKKANEFMLDYLKQLVRQKSKYFGNGRAIRKLVEKVIKVQNLRLAEMPAEKRTDKIRATITLDDVKDFDPTKDDFLESGKG